MVNFREYVTSSGLRIFGGRDSENNDKLVWDAKPKDILLHTEMPGSPFVNLGEKPSKKDINEATIFCAKYSQVWRDTKKDIIINKFQRSDMNKEKKMKSGTWGVSKQEKLKVKKGEILKFEKELREHDEKVNTSKSEKNGKTS
jgi:predicted ribosome quality control (RQC) complex YloA/Tae2 family protein